MSLHYNYKQPASQIVPTPQLASQQQTQTLQQPPIIPLTPVGVSSYVGVSQQNISSSSSIFVPPPSGGSCSTAIIPITLPATINNNNLHNAYFHLQNNNIIAGNFDSAPITSSQNQTINRSSSGSQSTFSNHQFQNTNLMMNSHMPMEITLNAHNHPDKHGRQIFINVGNMKMSERKLKVYENNNKLEDPEPIDLCIILEQIFDQGAFGRVRTARIKPDNRSVAVKHVLQDKRYRNRELPLMKQLSHRNIVKLLYYYYHMEFDQKKNLFLNLVMEYIPSNLNMLIQKNNKIRKNSRHSLPHGDLCSPSAGPVTPLLTIKLCMYQIFRALAYIHSQGICHRDIKPNNLLFNPDTGVLKICDFGSAKHLRKGESHVSYICARFYRAPELLFGATDYNEKIDLWSTGVVFSELLHGQPIFHEQSGIDQLVLIISKLGTPTKEQIKAMNQKYAKYDFPQVYCQPWQSLFPCAPTDALDLISQLFQYDPSHRIAPLHACAHQFFDELREPAKKWFGHDLPPLFDFTKYELSIDPAINNRLIPYKTKQNSINNIAYLQQQQIMNSRMFQQRNQALHSPQTMIAAQSSVTANSAGPYPPPTNTMYPNQNFPYIGPQQQMGLTSHYPPAINHQIGSAADETMFNQQPQQQQQSYLGPNTVTNNPLVTGATGPPASMMSSSLVQRPIKEEFDEY